MRPKVDYLYARLELGGPVTEEQLAEISYRGGATLFEGEREGKYVLEERLQPEGEFGYLESYLREQGIPYDRWSENRPWKPAQLVRWRPGFGSPLVLPAVNELTGSYADGARTAALTQSYIDGNITGNQLALKLIDLLGLQVPALPPFTLTDNENVPIITGASQEDQTLEEAEVEDEEAVLAA